MITKESLRKQGLNIRSMLDMKAFSKKIVANVREFDLYKQAQNVMIFYPLKDEVDLRELLNDDKNFYLPRIEGEELLVCPYKKDDELVVSSFKTMEPKTEPVEPDILEIIFVPAVLAGKDFNRIGYGKGFYDRFLIKSALNAIRIVPIPSPLLVELLPADVFDAPMDVILDDL